MDWERSRPNVSSEKSESQRVEFCIVSLEELTMYEVTFTKGGVVHRYQVSRFRRAREIARSVAGTIKKKHVDVWVADPQTKEMWRACRSLGISEALDWCAEVLFVDGRAGCMIIPKGNSMPPVFVIQRDSDRIQNERTENL
jgi:hypothetical protein